MVGVQLRELELKCEEKVVGSRFEEVKDCSLRLQP